METSIWHGFGFLLAASALGLMPELACRFPLRKVCCMLMPAAKMTLHSTTPDFWNQQTSIFKSLNKGFHHLSPPSYANLRQALQNRSCAEAEERGSIPDVFSVLSRWLWGEIYIYMYIYICNAGCNPVLPQVGKFNY